MKLVFAFTVFFAGYAATQSVTGSAAPPSSTGEISQCILTCSTQAAQTAGCTGMTDVTCVCGSTNFQQAALMCLQSQCPDEMAAATILQQQLCATFGSGTATASAPAATDTKFQGSETSELATASETETASGSRSGTTIATSTTPPGPASPPVEDGPRPGPATGTSRLGPSASNAPNDAIPTVFNFAGPGGWTFAALGVVAQLVL